MNWRKKIYFGLIGLFGINQALILIYMALGFDHHAIKNPLKEFNVNVAFLVFDKIEGFFVRTEYAVKAENDQVSFYLNTPLISNFFERSIFRSLEKFQNDIVFFEKSMEFFFCQKKSADLNKYFSTIEKVKVVELQSFSIKTGEVIYARKHTCE